MLDFILHLFATDFMPHGHCYFWQPAVLWLNVGSDGVIALAYFTIPLGIVSFVRRRPDVRFRATAVLFSAFILSCGVTHLFDVFTVWTPMYRMEGVLKLVTAAVSALTAVQVWRLLPGALSLPSPEQLEEVNETLRHEVEMRRAAELELQQTNQRLEERVADRTRELERKNRDLRQFAHAASHDLQEPLRMVSSFVGLLHRRYGEALDERAQRYMAFAVDGATRMQAMIDDLLIFSRAGGDVGLEVVEVEEVLGEARGLLERAFVEREVELVVPRRLPRVVASHGALRTLLQNLLSNAIKYSEGRPHIEVSAERVDGMWHVTVADEGIGIDPRHHDDVFVMYRRLHRNDEIEGTGLGLALARRIVESWQGELWLESAKGEGASFTFSVPAEGERAEGMADDGAVRT